MDALVIVLGVLALACLVLAVFMIFQRDDAVRLVDGVRFYLYSPQAEVLSNAQKVKLIRLLLEEK
jgi:hypothetical protein